MVAGCAAIVVEVNSFRDGSGNKTKHRLPAMALSVGIVPNLVGDREVNSETRTQTLNAGDQPVLGKQLP
jgi:hypothetical protein